MKDQTIRDESEMFESLVRAAQELRSDTFPENPEEFDVHVDMDNLFHMFIKGAWASTGVKFTPID